MRKDTLWQPTNQPLWFILLENGGFCGEGKDHKFSGVDICLCGYPRQGSDVGVEGVHSMGHRNFLTDSFCPVAEQLGGLSDKSYQRPNNPQKEAR